MPAWLIWLIISAALAAAETMSLAFVLAMCAGGAAAAAITAAAGAPGAIQVVVAIIVSLGLLAFVRPVARRELTGDVQHVTGVAALVGMEAVVLSRVDAHGGRIRLNGQEWSARAFDRTQVVPAGATVRVMEISGATAIVWEEP